MVGLDELSAILFGGSGEKSVPTESGAPQTTIIYGTALTNSADGVVTVKLDDAIYAADDIEDDDYEYISLTDEDDDVDAIEEDEELEDIDDETEIVYWQPDDDDAVGEDE